MKNQKSDWRPVVEFANDYEINRDGIIRSLKKCCAGSIVSQRIDRAGYVTVRLYKNGFAYTRYLHRILAQAFIENPMSKAYINHRNGSKTDNSIQNLEWVSHSENMLHAYRSGLIKKRLKVVVDNCSGKIFNGVKEAAEFYNLKAGTLRNYLNGQIKRNPTCLQYKEAA